LGLNDIHTLDDLARVKANCGKKHQEKWLGSFKRRRRALHKIGEDLNCNVAYFSLSEDNDFIKKLCAEGKQCRL
jgi:cyanophycin synthetase